MLAWSDSVGLEFRTFMRCHGILGIGPSPLREQEMLLTAEQLSSFRELFLKSPRRWGKPRLLPYPGKVTDIGLVKRLLFVSSDVF